MSLPLNPALVALFQVVLIDITLAGDNAVVIGMVARNVAPARRPRVIFFGLAAAVALLIAFATAATRLLEILGLTLTGGILLLLVSWRLYRDLRQGKQEREGFDTVSHREGLAELPNAHYLTTPSAIFRIAVADLSMSLDNVLAVAGAARGHEWVLIAGLSLSVTLVGVAAVYIAKLLQRYPWVSYCGLAMIVYIALRMIWEGGGQVLRAI